MENSSRFFANKECEYYPCHKSDGDINCLFCFCPLYNMECPGNYKIIDKVVELNRNRISYRLDKI